MNYQTNFAPNSNGECIVPGYVCEEIITYNHTVNWVYKPNDGVALNESSLAMPGMNESREMRESNHMQMRNDERLKSTLNNLFNGQIMGYFHTDRRNH